MDLTLVKEDREIYLFFLAHELFEVCTVIIPASSLECVLQSWPTCFMWKWKMFFFLYLFPGFLFEFADEGDFKCSGDLYAVDTVLKTEGSTNLSRSCKPLAGGSVLLPGLRWYLPIAVTCTCTESWIFKSPFCLFEVSFTVYISSGNQITEQKASLKICEMIAAATSFPPFHSNQTAVKFWHLSYFLNDVSYSWLAVVLSLLSSLVLCDTPAQLLKQLSFCLGYTFFRCYINSTFFLFLRFFYAVISWLSWK